MQLKQLEYFVEIAEQKSIHKAAEALYNSQPNLTRSIKAMEKELGGELFIRSSHGVELTPLGENAYYYSKSILKQMNVLSQVQQKGAEALNQKLSVSIARFILADDLVFHFYHHIHAQNTMIMINETTIENAVKEVACLTSEIALICANTIQYSSLQKNLVHLQMETLDISHGPLYIHFDQRSPLSSLDNVRLADLIPHTYIHLPADIYSNLNYCLESGGIQFTDLTHTITLNNYHHMLSMLKQVDSFILGNPWQINELKKAGIESRPLIDLHQNTYLFFIKRKKEILSKPAKAFIELIQKIYGPNSDTFKASPAPQT